MVKEEMYFYLDFFYLLVINSAFQKLSRTEGVILKDYKTFLVFG